MSRPSAVPPWFNLDRLDDGVSLIREMRVAPLLKCNIWHIRGRDRDLLVDTGNGIYSLVTAYPDMFERPLTVVLTHTHRDHMGGAHEFERVCVHHSEAVWAEKARDQLPLDTDLWPEDLQSWFLERGYDCSNGLVEGPIDPSRLMQAMAPAKFVEKLSEGDVIDIGNRAFEVLHLPGHSPGCIGLWDKKNGMLLSGDAVYDGPLLDNLEESNKADYATTMKRLSRIPAEKVLPGHGEILDGQRMRQLCDLWLGKQQL
jgi:glyoxylase-like metal-dependent hydrolase (beta-lactamase superfamily II)